MNEVELIEAGNRVESFLADPAIIAVFEKLDAQYYKQFKEARTVDDLALVKAKTTVLEDFQSGLRAVVSGGKHTSATRERRERNTSTRGIGR